MSDNILFDIENATYDVDCRYREVFPGEPKIIIKFSQEGYHRARHEKMSSCYFSVHISDDPPQNHFMGYPYEVVPGQVETFKVELKDE